MNNYEEKIIRELEEMVQSVKDTDSEDVWTADERKVWLLSSLHQQREMIRKEIGNELLKRMMKYDSEDGYSKMHDEVMEKVARDVDDIFLPPPQ